MEVAKHVKSNSVIRSWTGLSMLCCYTHVQTEEYNVMTNSEKLIGTKEHLTLLMSGHIRVKCRIISKQKMQHTYYTKVLPYSTVPTPKYFL